MVENKYTPTALEALAEAERIAIRMKNNNIESSHLLLTLLHETIAEYTSNRTYCKADPKIRFLKHNSSSSNIIAFDTKQLHFAYYV